MAEKEPRYSEKEYAEIGKLLVELQKKGIFNKRGFYKSSFLRGVLGGFGGVIGATVVVALVLWFIGLFEEVGFLENFVHTVQKTMSL